MLQQGLHARLAHLLRAPRATASGAAEDAGPGAPSASATREGSPPGEGVAAQARSAPAAGASKFVAWRKRKAEEAALAQSPGAECAGARAARAPGWALEYNSAAGSQFDTASIQVGAHGCNGGLPAASVPHGFAALPRSAPGRAAASAGTGWRRDDAACGDAFGWDRGAAARKGPGAALDGAGAGSSDAEQDLDEPSPWLRGASEETQGASPGGRSSGSAAPATAEGAGTGFGAGPEGCAVSSGAAGEGAQRDPGPCLVLVAEDSPMAGEQTFAYVNSW